MTLAEIGDPPYIALKTFRKTGEGVSTAVWVTVADGRLYVATGRSTGKVKRIANNSRVALCVGDMRGQPKGEWVEAEARIIESPDGIDAAMRRLRSKYRFQYRLFNMVGRGGFDAVIEISSRP